MKAPISVTAPFRYAPRMVYVDVQKTGPVLVDLPTYATADAAGVDLQAALSEAVTLGPGQRYLFPTGLRFKIPRGYEGQVRPRSGLALRLGLTVLNAPGTIDADYRGEVGVVLINLGEQPAVITPLMRIAQLIIAPVTTATLRWAEHLDSTSRGAGGYGSTGV